ncbi:cyclic peptide export ABC transporter [Magnetospirillum fulvum]|uniref:Putative ATP-binding cassette transporter n=1 Tax=Magnetospirillum fulvum TaxID=1082 RepID=A0A1H6HUS2_MAGFU|nr:cyclic peptide export ABC transporter [Magnetospirillum fulvum]SEH37895.1 putative ATP-binding cassette transporter [Magnetospirillum fulvum]
MKILDLLSVQGATPRLRLLGSAVASSIGGVFLLATVNLAAEKMAGEGFDQVDWGLASVFVAAAAIYYYAEVFLVGRVGADLEAAIDFLRVRILGRIRRADFVLLERIGHQTLFESVTQATQTISQNSQFLALALRSGILSVAVLFYILYLSPLAFVIVTLGVSGGGWVYARLGARLHRRHHEMMGEEAGLFESLSDLFDGFKEIRLSSQRSADFGRTVARQCRHVGTVRLDVQTHIFSQFIIGQVIFFLLLAVVVFAIPMYKLGADIDVVKVATAVIFIVGPLGALIHSLGILAASNAAAEKILRLDSQLAEMEDPVEQVEPAPLPADFATIRLSGIGYAYEGAEGESGFAIGPIDLSVKRGEVIFITGGNGSGKSTLMKVLCGFYRPQQGVIEIDTHPIGSTTMRSYRGLIAAVFSDFHLFPRLYAIPPERIAEAAPLLEMLEMERVSGLDGNRFTRIDLSTGQKKRLALVVALLERRPILVLDEWAADQDPHFRRRFYREILPELRRRGLTVIAVTHDDSYFDAADRRFHLDEGRLRPVPPSAAGV